MVKRKTLQEFIEQANKTHNNKYDYSKTKYINCRTKVVIICKKHGEFEQNPIKHLRGNECYLCGLDKMRDKQKRLGIEEFINRANEVHNKEYDYSQFIYLNNKIKGIIICLKHGKFLQSPLTHLKGSGCPKCYGTRKKTKKEFIKEASDVHNNKYDYSKLIYLNNKTKGVIICPKHGEFLKSPHNHLAGGGCPKCGWERIGPRKTKKDFVKEAYVVHNNKYDYSKFVYKNNTTKGIIICPKHGEFLQTPNNHLKGSGCRLCLCEKNSKINTKTLEKFIAQANKVHNNKYDYSQFVYKNNRTKGTIICFQHGKFIQEPYSHLKGYGCSVCGRVKMSNSLKLSKEEFVKRANIVHNDKYDYSKYKYMKYDDKGIIICSKHGEFKQSGGAHLKGQGCPKCSSNISHKSQAWLDSLGIPKSYREKIIKINNRIYKPDALDKKTNTIYEFYGDFWHGNPEIYDKNDMNTVNKETFGQLHKNTLKRENKLRAAGYKIIYIWEKDFDNTERLSYL